MTLVHTSAATLLILFVYAIIFFNVGRARGKYDIHAPHTTGNELFERAFRVQANTVEQMVFFLPAMWLYAMYISDMAAAIAGVIWALSRVAYAIGYVRNPKSREVGMIIGLITTIGMWAGAAYGVARICMEM